MYQLLDMKEKSSDLDKRVTKNWEENGIPEKSISFREGAKKFVFYEGPPTANGKPGIHHVMARSIKDVFCRYKTMTGYKVERKAGWDTHGLPVEIEAEKQIGIDNKEDIEKYAYINDIYKKIIDKFLPGPLTIILKKKEIIPDIVSKEYIGIRIPDSKIIREIATIPLTATSANLSGEEPPTSVDEINEELKEKVHLIIDTGVCKYKTPSTIIKIVNDNIELIREGAMPFKEIKKVIV